LLSLCVFKGIATFKSRPKDASCVSIASKDLCNFVASFARRDCSRSGQQMAVLLDQVAVLANLACQIREG
jgi:hypothetical protein